MFAFEFDRNKSDSNRAKHGIDFVEAQALWDGPDLLEIPAKTNDESRYFVIGCLGVQTLVCRHHLPRRPRPPDVCSQGKDRGGCNL